MSNIFHRFAMFKKRLLPPEEVAGLEVSDSFARLVLLSPETMNVVTAVEVSIPKGTIETGKIKSVANLVAALRTLRDSAGIEFAAHPFAILALPSDLFFTHILELPEMEEGAYDEAVRLNVAQLSPIQLRDSYFDWQNLGINLMTLESQIYVSLAAKSDIDAYLETMHQAGIHIVAVEPSSLGLIRILTYFVLTAEKQAPHLILAISQDGINFVVTKDAKPFFDYYFYWRNTPEAKDGQVSIEDFHSILRRELSKILAFYATRYKETVLNGVLLTPIFPEELARMLKSEFQLRIAGHRLPTFRGRPLPETWAGALGAALRGIIRRSEDTIVSLMPVGTEELFMRRQLVDFISIWGKIIAGVIVGVTMLYGTLFAISVRFRNAAEREMIFQRRSESFAELQDLIAKANEFNALVAKTTQARSGAKDWSDIFTFFEIAAGGTVRYERISIAIEQNSVTIQAFAPSRTEVLAFKKRFDDSGRFMEVHIPADSVVDIAGGVSFSMQATLK